MINISSNAVSLFSSTFNQSAFGKLDMYIECTSFSSLSHTNEPTDPANKDT